MTKSTTESRNSRKHQEKRIDDENEEGYRIIIARKREISETAATGTTNESTKTSTTTTATRRQLLDQEKEEDKDLEDLLHRSIILKLSSSSPNRASQPQPGRGRRPFVMVDSTKSSSQRQQQRSSRPVAASFIVKSLRINRLSLDNVLAENSRNDKPRHHQQLPGPSFHLRPITHRLSSSSTWSSSTSTSNTNGGVVVGGACGINAPPLPVPVPAPPHILPQIARGRQSMSPPKRVNFSQPILLKDKYDAIRKSLLLSTSVTAAMAAKTTAATRVRNRFLDDSLSTNEWSSTSTSSSSYKLSSSCFGGGPATDGLLLLDRQLNERLTRERPVESADVRVDQEFDSECCKDLFSLIDDDDEERINESSVVSKSLYWYFNYFLRGGIIL